MAQEHVASKSDKHANATASLIELYEETNIYEPMLKDLGKPVVHSNGSEQKWPE